MDNAGLVSRLLDDLPKAFQREDFSREKERLRQQYKQQADAIFQELTGMAKDRSVAVQQLPDGQIVFVPLHDGKPISPDEAQKLPPEELEKIDHIPLEHPPAAPADPRPPLPGKGGAGALS